MADVTKSKSGEPYNVTNRGTVIVAGYQAESRDIADHPKEQLADETPRVNDDDDLVIDGGTYGV